ncbi:MULTISPECIES: polymer-forming cytoskeletal protein [unclassified Nitrosospira]|uniref:bactofilin family protein n=1 Tax=unclassified Nitrosospira TaxID=2609267 RepID=UPI000D302011|nr:MULTISPECIES: polymer-forming cytoskeletal protein [unclassified Nitrosospira]PTR15751.1 cytoskeletal protein CcmA (bactofilin family) [Nitrosospira sp. Nsp2]WON74831.1 polymer-forming cytoskeletal protein [Nitrosospira sp. Is2]
MFGNGKTEKPQSQIDSLIGVGTHIDGNVNFSGGLRVDGRVTGNIVALGDKPSTLVLSDQAVIEGKIIVSHAVINGTVTGAIHASEYMELQPKAKVSGDVHYKAMEIQLGASVDGMLHHLDNIQVDNKVVPLIPASQSE